MSSHGKQHGFTLIELVVVLVILGILAAFAIPRFVNISTEARQSTVRGLAGSLRSSAALAHGLALARNVTNGVIQMEGAEISIVNGYPSAADVDADTFGIKGTIGNMDGFNENAPAAGQIRFTPVSLTNPTATCSVLYTQATAAAAAQVVVDDSNCS